MSSSPTLISIHLSNCVMTEWSIHRHRCQILFTRERESAGEGMEIEMEGEIKDLLCSDRSTKCLLAKVSDCCNIYSDRSDQTGILHQRNQLFKREQMKRPIHFPLISNFNCWKKSCCFFLSTCKAFIKKIFCHGWVAETRRNGSKCCSFIHKTQEETKHSRANSRQEQNNLAQCNNNGQNEVNTTQSLNRPN